MHWCLLAGKASPCVPKIPSLHRGCFLNRYALSPSHLVCYARTRTWCPTTAVGTDSPTNDVAQEEVEGEQREAGAIGEEDRRRTWGGRCDPPGKRHGHLPRERGRAAEDPRAYCANSRLGYCQLCNLLVWSMYFYIFVFLYRLQIHIFKSQIFTYPHRSSHYVCA
jgi:hypothetical protein